MPSPACLPRAQEINPMARTWTPSCTLVNHAIRNSRKSKGALRLLGPITYNKPPLGARYPHGLSNFQLLFIFLSILLFVFLN